MKIFAIGLLLLNLLYLSWNMGFLPSSDNADTVVVREPSQQAPQSLVLLSEMTNEQLLENTTAELEPVAPETMLLEEAPSQAPFNDHIIEENLACLAIGDFENIASANALVTELRSQGLQARVELQEQIDSEYRVYMPPFSSDTAARQTLANLLANGIDSFLITTGDLAQGISLGVFSQQTSAFTLQEELASEGYATNIQETVLSNTEFWIVIRSDTVSELEALWLSLLNTRASLKQSENLCQMIAPEA
jgi:hypothetical protein